MDRIYDALLDARRSRMWDNDIKCRVTNHNL